MPRFRTGNMWDIYDEADLFLITTNATVKKNGALVMGRGIAQKARDRFPGIDKALGLEIIRRRARNSVYGLLISPHWPAKKLGAFQVKYHWQEEAVPQLIRHSSNALVEWCEKHPTAVVHLNYPGIGNGRLEKSIVERFIGVLPDNVHIWTFRQERNHLGKLLMQVRAEIREEAQ